MRQLQIGQPAGRGGLTRETTALWVGLATYLAVLHLLYTFVVSPQWGYMGLVNVPAGDGSLILAYALACLPCIWLPASAQRVSDVVLWFLYVLAYIPAVIIPFYVLGEGWGQAMFTISLAAAFVITLIVRALATRTPPRSTLSDRQAKPLLSIATAVSIIVGLFLVAQLGLPQSLPDISSVYETRATYAELTTRFVSYVVGWSSNALLPFLIAAGIRWRSPLAVGVGLIGQLGIYSMTGFKEVPLSAVLTIALVVVLMRKPNHIGLLCTWGLVALIGVAMATGWLLDSNVPVSVLGRRLLIVPGQITAYYFEYFRGHDPYLLAHSVLRDITANPYDTVPPRLIAWLYFGDPAGNANANLWADGFANFRHFGVLAVGVLLGVLLTALDFVARHRDFAVAGAVLTTATLSIANSALLTSLLTHGIFLAALLVALLPTDSAAPESNETEPSDRFAGAPLAVQPAGRDP